jgi:hypothetical protein
VAVVNGENIIYKEISGDSTETKPTAGICDGSLFVESDTGDVYFFNEKSGDWVKQFSFQS